MTKSRVWRVLGIVALTAAIAAPAAAQQTTGTIQGTVMDQSGAILPGAVVVLKHVPTGRLREVVANASGRYAAALLEPGTYDVSFTLAGFQPLTIKGVELHVDDRLEVDGKLGIGAVTEQIEVSAASSFVQPSPAVQTLIGPTQVQELPLNNRNFVQLATLVPGVSSDLGDEVGIGLTSVVSVSVNGARRNAVNWLLDGVSNVDVGSNVTLLSTPTLESIQEFKIITSNYAAEWPRSGGGIVNVVTKSGTSTFSGSAYEFWRNDKLNANSFFRNRSTDPRQNSRPPRLRYNNFGATIGGPMLPGREKAFFFFSQEWREITREQVTITPANVPNPVWLTDPTNANYVAPANRDPNAEKLLALWPAPNQFTGTTAQFLPSIANVNDTRQSVVRIDYDFRPNWKIVGRYTHDSSETIEPGGLFTNTLVPNVSITSTAVPGDVGAFELRTNKGRALNEFKVQYSSNRIRTTDDPRNQNLRSQFSISIPELFPENEAGRIPTIAIGGLSTATTIQRFNIEYYNTTIADNFTLQRGNHTFKFGGLAAFEQKNENANNNTQGSFSFSAGGGRTAFQNFLTGNRDGLCGAGTNNCTYTEAEIDVTNNLRFNRYEMFAQDTWRMTPNITVDYGLRYSLYPPITDKNNILSTFDPTRYDPARAPTCANATCSALIPGTGDPLNGLIVAGLNSPWEDQIYPLDTDNFQPRVGMAWDVTGDGRTIGRFGYGNYNDQPLVGIFEQNAFTNPPYVNTVTLQNASLSDPRAGTAPGTTGLRSLIATSAPFKTPHTQQWNIGFQRQLYRRGAVDIGYVGARGSNLIQPVDINQPQPEDVVALGAINLARPYGGYTTINNRQTTARTRYWGMLSQFRHEGGREGTYTVNYTFSRARGTSTNDRDAVDLPQNPLDLEAEYADLRTDRRHMFSATYILELPFFKNASNVILKHALGGWQLSGITRIESGPPISRIVTSNNNGRRGIRANQVGDPKAGELDFPLWFDPTAFTTPPDGTYGTTGRAPFRLPGKNQTDLALSKNFYGWGRRIQFRADAINAFNHTQWLAVDNSCSATGSTVSRCDQTTFGQITSTRNPREIQLSLKLYW